MANPTTIPDSARIDGLLASCGISVMNVDEITNRDAIGWRFSCFVGPSSADVGAVAQAEAALIKAGYIPGFTWENDEAAKNGWGRCILKVL